MSRESREARIYQRFLVEERERYSDEARAQDEDDMREWIEKAEKRKAIMYEEHDKRRKKRKTEAINESPAATFLPEASSSSLTQPPASLSAPVHVEPAPPGGKRPSSPDSAAQTSHSRYAVNSSARSPRLIKRMPMRMTAPDDDATASDTRALDAVSATATIASSPPSAPDLTPPTAVQLATPPLDKEKGADTEPAVVAPTVASASASNVATSTPPDAPSTSAPSPTKKKKRELPPTFLSPPKASSSKSATVAARPTKSAKGAPKPPTKREIQRAEKTKKEAREAAKKAQEERESRMTHQEYIAYLPQKYATRNRKSVLQGCVFLYIHQENKMRTSVQSRRCYDLMWEHGAEIVAEFDPERVTHIISCKPKLVNQTCQACNVKTIHDIPERIKTFIWTWVTGCISANRILTAASDDNYKSFIDRPPIPESKKFNPRRHEERMRRNEHDSAEESSEDEAVADSKQKTGPIPVAGPSTVVAAPEKDDPLAEFYEQARYEAEDAVSGDEDDAEPDVDAGPSSKAKALKGFQCDIVGAHLSIGSECVNEDIVRKLEELMKIHDARRENESDKFRVIGYRKAIAALRRHPTRIQTAEEAGKLQGVGNKTSEKIMEIISTGGLERLKTERNDGVDVMELFRGIYSVGSTVARQWYTLGLRTLDDVRERKAGIRLSAAQEIGLRYYDDLNQRMPRAEAGEIYGMIKQRALDLDPKLDIEIMGSYRRRKETCGDIDILITRDPCDGKTHAGASRCLLHTTSSYHTCLGLLMKLLRVLHQDGILTEDLSVSHGAGTALEAKYMGIGRRDATSKRRRIDILTIPHEQWGGALLYFTGDDIFNRSIRLKASKMGYSLNQRGLYKGVIRDPRDRTVKLDSGELFASRTEREIFDALGVPWQEPWERVRG
ncbi:hypothetical protein EXIGLDRAFT_671776 [Exidia glandulosa HHB12029]|uniref:DNA polymerase lambda n=1 Tax=Exidia glandulosa HHB12029 TaxID=1314781 RepID=A0A165K6Y9_EXIGL|nr:hypothetical protein EXIGLDRAFT_671776 [Exidia glandulosa HHB12029]